MPMQKALSLVGVGKQTALGTPLANPAFVHGIVSGGIVTVELDQEASEVTSALRSPTQVDRTAVRAGFDFTTKCFPKSIGLWLYAALGAKSVTGAGPYTHLITPAGAPVYLTVWGSLDGTIVAVQDCVVDELEVSWDENNPPELKLSGKGGLVNFAPTFVGVVDESLDPYLLAAGGTYKLDMDSSTPATAAIKAGSYSIKNNAEHIALSGSVVASRAFMGRQEFETNATLIPDDLTDWRTVVTGTSSGTSASAATVYGSCEYMFPVGTNSLKIASTRVPFAIDFPEGDAGGGPVELEATGTPVMAAGGTAAVTATVINSQATY
jgi:hypothetical protein